MDNWYEIKREPSDSFELLEGLSRELGIQSELVPLPERCVAVFNSRNVRYEITTSADELQGTVHLLGAMFKKEDKQTIPYMLSHTYVRQGGATWRRTTPIRSTDEKFSMKCRDVYLPNSVLARLFEEVSAQSLSRAGEQ